jgi:hypothetical protein
MQEQPTGGVRPDAKENGQTSRLDCRLGAWNGGSSQHPTPVLQEGRNSANIHARPEAIWGIPVKTFRVVAT